MKPDIEKYRPYVVKFELSEEEQAELIHTVWNIMQNGFDRALGTDPVQQCLELRAAEIEPESGAVIE